MHFWYILYLAAALQNRKCFYALKSWCFFLYGSSSQGTRMDNGSSGPESSRVCRGRCTPIPAGSIWREAHKQHWQAMNAIKRTRRQGIYFFYIIYISNLITKNWQNVFHQNLQKQTWMPHPRISKCFCSSRFDKYTQHKSSIKTCFEDNERKMQIKSHQSLIELICRSLQTHNVPLNVFEKKVTKHLKQEPHNWCSFMYAWFIRESIRSFPRRVLSFYSSKTSARNLHRQNNVTLDVHSCVP